MAFSWVWVVTRKFEHGALQSIQPKTLLGVHSSIADMPLIVFRCFDCPCPAFASILPPAPGRSVQ
jgi:hypothetical protein